MAEIGDEKILTTVQAGERLGVSDQRVRDLIDAGRLPAEKVGGRWLIREKDLHKVRDRKPGRPPERKDDD